MSEVAELVGMFGALTAAIFSVKIWYKLGGYDAKFEEHARRIEKVERKLNL